MTEDMKPFAASIRRPNPDALPPGVDYTDEIEPPPEYGSAAKAFYTGDADEEARQVRLSAPPTPKPEVTPEERARLVAGCAEAIVAWSPLVYGIADMLVRALSDLLGVGVEEAERLVGAEIQRRAVGKK